MSRFKWQIIVLAVLAVMLAGASALADRMSKSESFKVKKGGSLVVEVEHVSADIHIKAWSKDEVLVKVDGLSDEDMEDLEIKQSGNTVYAEYYGRDSWHGRRGRHARFVITVPAEFNLDLSTSGGDISVEDRIKGKVSAGTSGGDVSVEDVEGELELATSGGDISARNVIGDVEVATSGGDIDIGKVSGSVDAATYGGDIEVGDVGQDLNAKTAGGDIIIGNVGGSVDVATAGGDVEVGRVTGGADLRTAGGDIEVLAANGDIGARTAGGDITLSGIKGSVDAETAGGDIDVELTPDGKRGSVLETKGGDIVLLIPANSMVTILAEIRIHDRGWDDGYYDDYDDYDIISDFKPESKDKDRRGIRAKYVLNGGGPRIELETMNGDIEIRKSR